MLQNILTYRVEIACDISIGVTQNCQPQFVQCCIAFSIRSLPCGFIMLRAVKFDNKFRLRAIKIDNVMSDYFLTIHSDRKFFQKVIPEMTFFLCHLFPQILGVLCQLGIAV